MNRPPKTVLFRNPAPKIPAFPYQNPMSEPADRRPMAAAASAAAVTISSQVMIATVIFLFMVVVFIFFLYLYAKHYMGSNRVLHRSRGRFIFASADQILVPRRGLDAEVLKSLPVTIFRPSEFKDGLECAVCLSELSEGEEARILPKCNHGFHVGCIDMWLNSHTNCPICRAPVTAEAKLSETQPQEGNPSTGQSAELVSFPANVLFWGNQDQVRNGASTTQGAALQEGSSSSSGLKRPEGMLVIDIPRRAVEDIVSPLPTSRFPAEEMKSPMEEKTPKSARLRSLRRLLSRGKMVIGSSYSPRGGDIEEGAGGALGKGSSLTPKTPTS